MKSAARSSCLHPAAGQIEFPIGTSESRHQSLKISDVEHQYELLLQLAWPDIIASKAVLSNKIFRSSRRFIFIGSACFSPKTTFLYIPLQFVSSVIIFRTGLVPVISYKQTHLDYFAGTLLSL